MRESRPRHKRLMWTTCALIVGASAQAQAPAAGVRAGLELSRRLCADCHAVERGNRHSLDPRAPAFTAIAGVRGMSARALTAALQSSHRAMPDMILTSDERANLVAYILSLRAD